MFQEEWKDIPTWEGIYQISNYGRIRRLFKTSGFHYRIPQKINSGYHLIILYNKGRKQQWLVHRLVATVFQRPLLETEAAHHKNEFKFCNCKWNIEIKDEGKHMQDHWKEEQFRNKIISTESTKKRLATRRQKKLLDPNYLKRKNSF